MSDIDLGRRTKPFTITLPATIDEKSKALATHLKVSRSYLISSLLHMVVGQELDSPQGKEVERFFLKVLEMRNLRSQKDEEKKFKEIFDSLSGAATPSPTPAAPLKVVKTASKRRPVSPAAASLDTLRNGREVATGNVQPA